MIRSRAVITAWRHSRYWSSTSRYSAVFEQQNRQRGRQRARREREYRPIDPERRMVKGYLPSQMGKIQLRDLIEDDLQDELDLARYLNHDLKHKRKSLFQYESILLCLMEYPKRVHGRLDLRDELFPIFQEMNQSLTINCTHFGILIEACIKAGRFDEAVEFFKGALEKGIVQEMLPALERLVHKTDAPTVFQSLEVAKEYGMLISAKGYATAMDTLAKGGKQYLRVAESLFPRLVSLGTERLTTTCNSMIQGYAALDDAEGAIRWYKCLSAFECLGVYPNERTLTKMTNAAYDHPMLPNIVVDITDKGVFLNAIAITTLMERQYAQGNYNEVESIFALNGGGYGGATASAHAIGVAMKAVLRNGAIERCLSLPSILYKIGKQPTFDIMHSYSQALGSYTLTRTDCRDLFMMLSASEVDIRLLSLQHLIDIAQQAKDGRIPNTTDAIVDALFANTPLIE